MPSSKYPATGGEGGAWTPIETQTVAGAAVQTVTFSGLTATKAIRIAGIIRNGSGSGWNGLLHINGATTNISFAANDTTTAAVSAAGSEFYTIGPDGHAYVDFVLHVKTGGRRSGFAICGTDSGSTFTRIRVVGIGFNNTATAITSVGFSSGNASAYGVGTELTAYEMVQ